MKRLVFSFATAVALSASPASAQSLGGDIWSGFSSGLSGGFNGEIGSGFQSGLGAPSGRRRAVVSDVTLGFDGTGFRMGFLQGQPSNFAASVAATAPLPGSVLTFDNGPAGPLDMGAGPAGPLD